MDEQKKIVDLKTAEFDIYGYDGGVLDYTPKVFEDKGYPEELWWSVEIRPLLSSEFVRVSQILAKIRVDISMRLVELGISDQVGIIEKKISKVDEKTPILDVLSTAEWQLYKAHTEYINSLDDMTSRYEIIVPTLGKLSGHKKSEEMTAEVWESTPEFIRRDIYNKVIEISTLQNSDIANL